jgi:hypothetical protein
MHGSVTLFSDQAGDFSEALGELYVSEDQRAVSGETLSPVTHFAPGRRGESRRAADDRQPAAAVLWLAGDHEARARVGGG